LTTVRDLAWARGLARGGRPAPWRPPLSWIGPLGFPDTLLDTDRLKSAGW